MNQNLKKRVKALEDMSNVKEYESGAWIIIEESQTRYHLLTSRLGRFTFRSSEELSGFIRKHHRGVCPDWSEAGISGFIKVKHAVPGEELPTRHTI